MLFRSVVSGLTCMSLIHFSWFLGLVSYSGDPFLFFSFFHSFVCGYLDFPTPFVEETILFLLCILGILVEDQLTVYAWVYFGAPSSVPLIYMSVFMPLSYCFNYCSFEIYFKIRKCDASSFVLLSQDCFGYSGPFVVPYDH